MIAAAVKQLPTDAQGNRHHAVVPITRTQLNIIQTGTLGCP